MAEADLKRIGFVGYIAKVEVKRLESQDKELRIWLEVPYPSDDLVSALNTLFIPDRPVAVAVAETERANVEDERAVDKKD